MTWWQIVIGLLLFAMAAAVLYIWGLRKSMYQHGDLMNILIGKAAHRVVKYLKKHKTISIAEMERQIANVQARMWWSKQGATVENPKAFVRQVTEYLLSQQLIELVPKSGKYRLK